MAELDTVVLYNPTLKDFTWKYNGEPYRIMAKERKPFAKYVGFHLAKHLSTQMLHEAMTPEERKDRTKEAELAQRIVYDNPDRRIALYKIFGSKELVQEVINHYPFKGFQGEMSVYEKFVEKELAKESKKSGDEE